MAAEQVTLLNRKRSGLRGTITKYQNFVLEAEKTGKFEIAQLEVKISKVKELNSRLEGLRLEYYQIIKDEDIAEIEENIEEIETDITELEVSFKRLYNSLCNNKQRDSTTIDSGINNAYVKLPEISLPKFSGQFEEWNVFKNQFVSLISSNNQLSESQKLYYLQSCLIGNARQMQTVDDTFSSLFKALEDRFDNKRLIVNTHVNGLLSIEKVHNESPSDLRSLIDNIQKHLRALKLMDLELDKLSEVLLINIISHKLDRESQKQFEMSLTSSELTTWNTFISFVQKRCQILENIQGKTAQFSKRKFDAQNKSRSLVTKINTSTPSCVICKKSHLIFKCEVFLGLNPMERYDLIKKHALCINCFSPNHKVSACRSKSCNVCFAKHNSLLHRTPASQNVSLETGNDKQNKEMKPPSVNSQQINKDEPSPDSFAFSSSCLLSKNKTTVLSTAIVFVQNIYGNFVKAKVVLDSGSQSNFVTQDFANSANLRKEKTNIPVSSLCGTINIIKSQAFATITNGNNSFSATMDFLIVPKITDMVPAKRLDLKNIEIPPRSMLADPEFEIPSKIDMLLGIERYFDIVKAEQIRFSSNSLIFQNTVFGYIASGYTETAPKSPISYCGFSSQCENLDRIVERFWLIEDVEREKRMLSKEEEYCESHFKETHRRNEDGRYVVKMPIQDEKLGNSKHLANIRLNQVVKRLDKDLVLKTLYHDFMLEYESLDHMERVKDNVDPEMTYYMPHHGIYRPEKTSTKLRVVFNASAATSTGKSLNDLLLAGSVQENIFDLMVRFRKYKFAFTADIKQMYRQILIDESQRDLLRILWKTDVRDTPMTYRLKTITYGTKSAPFLAIRALKQLAEDEKENFPLAAEVTLNSWYMDDVLTGAKDLETAKDLQQQLIGMLSSCGMQLHKWNSNTTELLHSFENQNHEHHFSSYADSTVKTLGIIWKSQEDQFCFKVSVVDKPTYTKRDVLSTIARLYDPLGLIGPVITKAKIFLQDLWVKGLNWDDSLPEEISSEWKQLVLSLKQIENIKISRYVLTDETKGIVLSGFADASQGAYGAVVYILCNCANGVKSSHLLASKSRVAPLKVISIPRLELCSCLLLSQLMDKVRTSLQLTIDEFILHTDSTIALAWINTPPHRLKSFIGNRVSKIQGLTNPCQWRHVPSSANPADIISRGAYPKELAASSLWWSGTEPAAVPTDLSFQEACSDSSIYVSELKAQTDITLNTTIDNTFWTDLFNLTNNYSRLIRIISFLCRFLNNVKEPDNKLKGPLTVEEIRSAETLVLRQVQSGEFFQEIEAIRKGLPVSPKSKLRSLNPFLSSDGLLRVGGRLQRSQLGYNAKFPIILPSKHNLTSIIVRHYHIKNLHIGPYGLLSSIRQKFWPLSGRNLTRKIVHECITCFRHRPIVAEQLMGNLPTERVNLGSTFNNTGIDFCGPFLIKFKNQRKGTFQKIYVAIFVCLATRAIHLEVVSDLTTEALVATLKRFFARRGRSSCIFTDNATNFIGASQELKRLYRLVKNPDEHLGNYLSSEEVAWKFIPPRSPNFGGLWEAGVKSFKHHLKRTLGSTKVTLEEFWTLVIQIEGILNSRPIVPMSTDSKDLEALTPGHFLIGHPINSIVEPDITGVPDNRLSRWKLLSKMFQSIWKRWHLDYLSHLQQRSKWQFQKDNVKLGTLVLLKEDNLPPFKWVLGRITDIVKGPDGKVRVFYVRTADGIYKRSISKICILPLV